MIEEDNKNLISKRLQIKILNHIRRTCSGAYNMDYLERD